MASNLDKAISMKKGREIWIHAGQGKRMKTFFISLTSLKESKINVMVISKKSEFESLKNYHCCLGIEDKVKSR